MRITPRPRSPLRGGARTDGYLVSAGRQQKAGRDRGSLLDDDSSSNLDHRRSRSGVAMDTISELEKVGSWHTPQKMRFASQG